MIDILIIEDDEEQKNDLVNLIKKLFNQQCLEYDIKWASKLFKNFDILNNFDIIFLDVEIDNGNGIEFAKKFRESNPDLLIIITSQFPQYLINGYSIDAKRYFLKPIDQKIFEIEMTNVLTSSFKKQLGFYDPKIASFKIFYNNILYVEFVDRVTMIHFTNGSVLRCQYNLKYWIEKLKNYSFSQPYRSYIVNLDYVSGFTFDGRDIIMSNNERIPISKHFKKDFEELYFRNLHTCL